MSTLYTFACDGTFAIVEDAERARAKLEAGWQWMDMDAVMEAWAARDLAAFDAMWDELERKAVLGLGTTTGEPAVSIGPVVAMAFGARRKTAP